MATVSPSGELALARQARERFADETARLLQTLPERISAALEIPNAKKTAFDALEVMEAQAAFRQKASAWLETARREWRRKARGELPAGKAEPELDRAADADDKSGLTSFALVDDDEMDRTVAAGRLVLAIQDKAGRQWSDLRARMQRLEGLSSFSPGDVLRPETFAQTLLDAWADCGLTPHQWAMAQDAIHQQAAQSLSEAYGHANAFLTERGVTAKIDLRDQVRRAPDRAGAGGGVPGGPATVSGGLHPASACSSYGDGSPGQSAAVAGGMGSFAYAPPGSAGRTPYETALYSRGAGGAGVATGASAVPGIPGMPPAAGGFVYAPPGSAGRVQYEAALYYGNDAGASAAPGMVGTPPAAGGFVYAPPGSAGRVQYEAVIRGAGSGGAVSSLGMGAGGGLALGSGPGMAAGGATLLTAAGPAFGGWGGGELAAVPLSMAQRQRAQGVLGDLRQFAERHGAALAIGGAARTVSPGLALVLAEPDSAFLLQAQDLPNGQEPAGAEVLGAAALERAVRKLKDKAEALKDKAERPDEKAVIEIVSLMFQAILADERIPSMLRVWFGRLQVPVLRVALAEPEFFAAPDHPARQLIDRMGACAMGLDEASVDGARLEQEVKRVVQVIEQYPETGKQVFQLVLEEFQKFLNSALAQGKHAQQFATLAQQVEQKDALAIQYTIELRNLLGAVPVNEDVRAFFFRVWSEVLALAAVRRGAQDAQTLRFKQAAVDLLWAVSSKADHAERQQIVQYLPGILKTLREGMQTLAMQADEQDGHIRLINQAVTQAFNSSGPGISPAQMNELARALTGLEDVVTDDPEGDLLLDPALLEQMLGVASQDLQVIAAGGARPGEDTLQWARELQPGQWFTLQYQGAVARAQYVWHSARGQLHLFVTPSGKSYLAQTRRLASYLQAGLIAPVDDEPLSIRATREALT
ncbi:MAG: DUF1631 domain-containing protein, partial [Burkholderiaceae bacterium]|nr:DUF1631 domain-containing protein [Burkholderiaceae bacterium]